MYPRLPLLLIALSWACDAPARPAVEPTVEARPQNPDADTLADRLRDTLLGFNPEDCVGEAEALLRGPPSSPRLRAWAIACVAEAGQFAEADSLATAMQRDLPGEPWAEFASITAGLAAGRVPEPTALPRSAALLTALDHPDVLRLRARALLSHERADEVLELVRAHPDALQTARVRALFIRAFDDQSLRPEALAAARQLEGPAAFDAAYVAAYWLWRYDRHDEALAAIDLALARSPRSVMLHRQRWQILYAQTGRSEEQRREVVSAAIMALLALRGDTPSALLAAAEMYRELGLEDRAAPLEARLLASDGPARSTGSIEARRSDDFADSPAAEALLTGRLETTHYRNKPNSPEQAAEHRAQLAAVMARPRWHDPRRREGVAIMHFDALREDPTTPPEALLAAVEALVGNVRLNPHILYGVGVITLAERTPYLERAEAIAREGLVAAAAFAAAMEQTGTSAEVIKAVRDDMLGTGHDALGAVLLAAGRLDEAEAALGTAHTLAPKYPPNLVHLAALADRRGDRKAAESYLIAGRDTAWAGERNPCDLALEARYRSEHGSLRGYPRHLEQLTADQRAARRIEILATAAAAPALPPPFTLERLDGVKVTSDQLRGKITVIKFWFIGCTPCVTEMPEFQALADAYARDPAVQILSIATDDEPAKLSEWMHEHGHRFDVLLDRGYAETAGVRRFPTLWVLDREGRVAFTHAGMTQHLHEESTWRIESLRNGAK